MYKSNFLFAESCKGIRQQPSVNHGNTAFHLYSKGAFINPCLNSTFTTTVYNINPGMNSELMEACKLLKEYVQFTEKIRENRKTIELKVAVNKAVDDCIREGILKDFLREQRAEVIAMSIYEYDQEMHMQVVTPIFA